MLNVKLSEKEMLTYLRRKKGIRQKELAKLMRVSQPFLSQLENGERNFNQKRYAQYKQLILEYDKDKQQENVDNAG